MKFLDLLIEFEPKIPFKIRETTWAEGFYFEALAEVDNRFYGRSDSGMPGFIRREDERDWEPYVKPKKTVMKEVELWQRIIPGGVTSASLITTAEKEANKFEIYTRWIKIIGTEEIEE